MQPSIGTGASAIAFLALLGCGQVADPNEAPKPAGGAPAPTGAAVASEHTGTIVTASDGTKFVGEAVAIDVRFLDGHVQADVALLAYGRNEMITALVRVPEEFVPMGSGEASIAQVPLEPGIGWVERTRKGEETKRGTSGTMSYVLDGRRISWAIREDVPDLSASVDATFQVRCWVPPADIGIREQGTVAGGGQQLAIDTRFQTEFCRRFRQP